MPYLRLRRVRYTPTTRGHVPGRLLRITVFSQMHDTTSLLIYLSFNKLSATSLNTNFLIFPLPVRGMSSGQSSPSQKTCAGALCLPRTFRTQLLTSSRSGLSVPSSRSRKAAGTSTYRGCDTPTMIARAIDGCWTRRSSISRG
jgi:hypothetical protein